MTDATAPETLIVDVCAVDELRDGEIRLVELDRRPAIGVTLAAGRVRAFSVMCPHRGGPLEKGTVRSQVFSDAVGERRLDHSRPVIACPWHKWEFSLDDGCATVDARRRIRIYETVVVDGRVQLRLEQRGASK